MPIIMCRPRSLPIDKLRQAEDRATKINPVNAIVHRSVMRTPRGQRGGPRRLAVLIARKWQKEGVQLTVSFLDNPSKPPRARILSHMNAWPEHANVGVVEIAETGQVRISRLDAPESVARYWSSIGTDPGNRRRQAETVKASLERNSLHLNRC
jgi:hypothetical protein